MTSMYETIMELPLFKGIGADLLSSMLEKTSLEFLNFEHGDVVVRADDRVQFLTFILKGELLLTYNLPNLNLKVVEIRVPGCVVGARNLYGMHTDYVASGVACGKLSVLRISKEQYMNIISSDRIFLLNFLNYLSAAAQRPSVRLLQSSGYSVSGLLCNLVDTLSSPLAPNAGIVGTDKALAAYCGKTENEIEIWKIKASHQNIIKIQDNTIWFRFSDSGSE